MQKFLKTLIPLIILVSVISCQGNEQAADIIEPIKLIAGEADSLIIRDLFYADDYDFELIENANLETNFDKSQIIIKAKPNFEGMTLLGLEGKNGISQIPIISKKANVYSFSYKPLKKYNRLTLFGSFNGWNRTNLPMTDENGDGIFDRSVILDPGIYQYKFYGDGEEIIDPLNPNIIPNGMGSFNSIRTIEDTDTNKFYLHIHNYSIMNGQIEFSFLLEDDADSLIEEQNVFALLNNSAINKSQIRIEGGIISLLFEKAELIGKNTLRIAVSKYGKVTNIQSVILIDGNPIDNSTFTWNDGIIYSLMIDRFSDGNTDNDNPIKQDSLLAKANYFGGDLEGIIKKLDEGYFENLGVNVIWISPVLDNPNKAYKEYPAPHRYYSGYHGYWPISSKSVDEHFGNLENVKEFVTKAHAKGIRVLLDFVSNHVHIEHPYFKEHRDWFGTLELPDGRLNLRFWDEYRLTTWFEPYLASFDYLSSKEALEEMTDIAVWWLNETGADGYRHDAVKHVPNEFWRRLNEKIRLQVATKRELPVYQIGETFGSYELISSYVNNGQLNSQFNFNLYDVALQIFINEESTFAQLDKEMQKTFSVYGTNHLMGNVMDSHDKNRFMAFADGDLAPSEWSAIEQGWNNPPVVDNPDNYKKVILYMAYMNSIPGLPVIYYGSEFGMSGASDPDNRRMMRFGEDLSEGEKNTLSEVSKIVKLRREHTALRYGDFYSIKADKDIYAFIRTDMNEKVLIVLNKNLTAQDLLLNIPEQIEIKLALNLRNNIGTDIGNNILKTEIAGMDWAMYLLK